METKSKFCGHDIDVTISNFASFDGQSLVKVEVILPIDGCEFMGTGVDETEEKAYKEAIKSLKNDLDDFASDEVIKNAKQQLLEAQQDLENTKKYYQVARQFMKSEALA